MLKIFLDEKLLSLFHQLLKPIRIQIWIGFFQKDKKTFRNLSFEGVNQIVIGLREPRIFETKQF
jgi:hypothetical protein